MVRARRLRQDLQLGARCHGNGGHLPTANADGDGGGSGRDGQQRGGGCCSGGGGRCSLVGGRRGGCALLLRARDAARARVDGGRNLLQAIRDIQHIVLAGLRAILKQAAQGPVRKGDGDLADGGVAVEGNRVRRACSTSTSSIMMLVIA